ncbi:MAG: hypothetical protein JWM95_5281 [Gemmatimonadetes bacterium]|nr:hypothetical protein [Gemmatimonadota bacterium]
MTRLLQFIFPLWCIIASGCTTGDSSERRASTEGTPKVDSVRADQANDRLTAGLGLQTDTASIRLFVQDFYDWYVPVARKEVDGPAWYHVLQSRDTSLTTGLAAGLRADSTVQAGLKGEVTNLNFDPFLASQDPCARYEVRAIQPKAALYTVTVRPVCSSGNKMPDVHMEVARHGNGWQFENFFYDGTDLRALLCETAKQAAGQRPVAAELLCGTT